MSDPPNEPTVESRLAFQGKILNVRVDKVRLSSGDLATREIIEHAEVVCIVPMDEERRVLMVRQYRKPAEATLLEIPAGRVEPGEVSEEAALRELQEETGYAADSLQHLCSFYPSPGVSTEVIHSYLATGLKPGRPEYVPDDDEEIQEVVRVPLDRAPEMIRAREIRDAKSITSLLMVLSLYTK